MKKLLMSTAGVVLTIAICMGLAGCSGNGALAEARSIRGEEVSEEEWNAAFKGLGGEEGFTVPLSAAPEEGQTPQVSPANFAVEYETETRMDVTVEEQTVNGEVLVEAAEASVTMKIWATVTVADHKMHMEVGYDGRVDGSENVLEQLGGETISGSGGVEVYTAVQDGVTQVYARVDGGEWQTATGGASALEGVSEAVLAQIDVLIDELSDIGDYYGQYKDFTYNGDKKGYVYQDGSLGSAIGGMVGGDLIVKLRGGRLAAVLQEGEINMDLLGVGITGSAAMGMVYTMGGQSVTLPKV